MALTYKKAGVDIVKADGLVDDIVKMAKTTNRPGVVGNIGGFAAFFKAMNKGMKEPLLVASTDGVGTKLLLAIKQDLHHTVGIDLVAMSVNDVICSGAEPLFFLDYFATGGLNLRQSRAIIKGVVEGCKQANCALIGGETAEMPGMYKKGDYDLAGFCVGVVDRKKAVTGEKVRPGDVVLGLLSSGLHSNGFSLARKAFSEKELKGPWGRKLLTPTIIYVKPIMALVKKGLANAVSHITGSGFEGNIPRVIPENLHVEINLKSWKVPAIFREIQRRGRVPEQEMFSTFNMGVGMVVVVSPKRAATARRILSNHGVRSVVLGSVKKGGPGVVFKP